LTAWLRRILVTNLANLARRYLDNQGRNVRLERQLARSRASRQGPGASAMAACCTGKAFRSGFGPALTAARYSSTARTRRGSAPGEVCGSVSGGSVLAGCQSSVRFVTALPYRRGAGPVRPGSRGPGTCPWPWRDPPRHQARQLAGGRAWRPLGHRFRCGSLSGGCRPDCFGRPAHGNAFALLHGEDLTDRLNQPVTSFQLHMHQLDQKRHGIALMPIVLHRGRLPAFPGLLKAQEGVWGEKEQTREETERAETGKLLAEKETRLARLRRRGFASRCMAPSARLRRETGRDGGPGSAARPPNRPGGVLSPRRASGECGTSAIEVIVPQKR
jgi:hypothetical protein